MKGRSKRTPETINKVLTLVRNAVTTEGACAMAGISKPTWYSWLSKDPELKVQYEEAVASSEASLVLEIRKDISWQSKAWLLERRFPDRWRKREDINQNVKGEKVIHLVWGDEEKNQKIEVNDEGSN